MVRAATATLTCPREVHVRVMLDNGRSTMLADPVLREALYCLRCGACLNVCPVYRRIGGHAGRYSGPIGSIVAPSLFGSAGAVAVRVYAMERCRDICPVSIDIPRLLLHLRWKENLGIGAPRVEFPGEVARSRNGMRRFARMARWSRLIRLALLIGAFVARPFAREGYLRWIPGPFKSWTRGRDFPTLRGH